MSSNCGCDSGIAVNIMVGRVRVNVCPCCAKKIQEAQRKAETEKCPTCDKEVSKGQLVRNTSLDKKVCSSCDSKTNQIVQLLVLEGQITYPRRF